MKRALLFVLTLLLAAPVFALSRDDFQANMRKLWEEHVTWTRLYIVSAAAGLPDAQPTAQRLLENQRDIGNAVAEFYGKDAGDKLTSLLRAHILTAADLVTAAKAGDQAKVAAAKTKWYANANEIAAFLHGANPNNWPLATLQSEMKTHLDQTLDEATHQLHHDYPASIKDYDAIEHHILMMADVLSSGIIKQFPKKFDRA
jgi:hypothetical protein